MQPPKTLYKNKRGTKLSPVTGSGTKAKRYVFALYLPQNGKYFKSTY